MSQSIQHLTGFLSQNRKISSMILFREKHCFWLKRLDRGLRPVWRVLLVQAIYDKSVENTWQGSAHVLNCAHKGRWTDGCKGLAPWGKSEHQRARVLVNCQWRRL